MAAANRFYRRETLATKVCRCWLAWILGTFSSLGEHQQRSNDLGGAPMGPWHQVLGGKRCVVALIITSSRDPFRAASMCVWRHWTSTTRHRTQDKALFGLYSKIHLVCPGGLLPCAQQLFVVVWWAVFIHFEYLDMGRRSHSLEADFRQLLPSQRGT